MNEWCYENTTFQHTCQRKKRQRAISMGASQTALKYTTKSMSFWVSADTRFTISPTVQVLLAALFITKDWDDNKRKDMWGTVCSFCLEGEKSFVFLLFKIQLMSCEEVSEWPNVYWCRFTHLPVNQAHNSCLHPHSHSEACVHVLMIEERLKARQQEH